MTFDELLNQSKSKIEEHLLRSLYFALPKSVQGELVAQYLIDEFEDVTLPDFAFPDRKIAIYCDGYEWHKDPDSFQKDRFQSRELQLGGWLVLRFAGREIESDLEGTVDTILRALESPKVNYNIPDHQQDLQTDEEQVPFSKEPQDRFARLKGNIDHLLSGESETCQTDPVKVKEIKSEERHTSSDFTEGISNPQPRKAQPEQPKLQNPKSKFTRPIPKEYLQEKK